MWVFDHKGALVNLDNAVWVGIVERPLEDHGDYPETAVAPALVAHMIDGTSITLEVRTEVAIRAKLDDLAARLFGNRRPMAGVREIGSRMRHGD